jgi:hypothetical protein
VQGFQSLGEKGKGEKAKFIRVGFPSVPLRLFAFSPALKTPLPSFPKTLPQISLQFLIEMKQMKRTTY